MKVKAKELSGEINQGISDIITECCHIPETEINDEAFDRLREHLQKDELVLADDALLKICRLALERDFLNDINKDMCFRIKKGDIHKEQGWIQVTKLPVMSLGKTYALYSQWQNVIATMYNLNQKLCYVLLREEGETGLYLGAFPNTPGVNSEEARSQLLYAISGQIPEIGLKSVEKDDLNVLKTLNYCGAVTGIPSVRKSEEHGKYQTMDQVAMGLRIGNENRDFSVVIIAEPVRDAQIVKALRSMESYGSEVHTLTQYTSAEETNEKTDVSMTFSKGVDVGVNAGMSCSGGVGIQAPITVHVDQDFSINGNVGASASASKVKGVGVGHSSSVSQQHINKSAMYCEEILDKHIRRMKTGRNLGLWKTGIYVLGESAFDVQTIMGILRAVYSGDDTYLEPIKTTIMPTNSGAAMLVHNFRQIPYSQPVISSMFGSIFEDYATPMTTEELSVAMGLPEKNGL